jgi:hypothetical protein
MESSRKRVLMDVGCTVQPEQSSNERTAGDRESQAPVVQSLTASGRVGLRRKEIRGSAPPLNMLRRRLLFEGDPRTSDLPGEFLILPVLQDGLAELFEERIHCKTGF